jgi:hypothetical protein
VEFSPDDFLGGRTDLESMMAAVGAALRLATWRTWSRSWPGMISVEPSACHSAAQ